MRREKPLIGMFMKKVCILLFVVFFIVSPFKVLAQDTLPLNRPLYTGKSFWMTLFLGRQANANEFYITGKKDATVTITFGDNSIVQTYDHLAGAVTRIFVTPAQFQQMNATSVETVEKKSVHIRSTEKISVQFASWGGFTDDGTLLFPTDRQDWGKVFIFNGPRTGDGYWGNSGSPFSIVATCNDVVLEITPSVNTPGHAALVPFQLTLQRGSVSFVMIRHP